jgi:hypothetical protein
MKQPLSIENAAGFSARRLGPSLAGVAPVCHAETIPAAAGKQLARRGRARFPTASQQGDRRLIAISMFGLVCGPVVELGSGLGTSVVGIGIGLCSLAAARRRSFGVAVARGTSSVTVSLNGVPRRCLSDGLLRIVGPVYQFRHAAFQDHLAPPAKMAPADNLFAERIKRGNLHSVDGSECSARALEKAPPNNVSWNRRMRVAY